MQTEKYSLLTHFHIVKSVCLGPRNNPTDYKVSCLESYETPHKKSYMYCILYGFQAICKRTK